MKRILVFGAAWCQSCQSLKQVIKNNLIPANQIAQIDADEEPALLKEFGIRSLPTTILQVQQDGYWQEVARKTGSMTHQQLVDFCNQA